MISCRVRSLRRRRPSMRLTRVPTGVAASCRVPDDVLLAKSVGPPSGPTIAATGAGT